MPFLHEVYSGMCRTYTVFTVEIAVRTQYLQWKLPTYTVFTVEIAVHTQYLQWKMPFLHEVYSGKCRSYMRSTVENSVST